MNHIKLTINRIISSFTKIQCFRGFALVFIASSLSLILIIAQSVDTNVMSGTKFWDIGPINSKISVGDPISATSGNMYYEITDVVIGSDFEIQLEFTRSYNSAGTYDTYPSGLGPKWTHSYSDYIIESSYGWITLNESTGRRVPFVNFAGPQI